MIKNKYDHITDSILFDTLNGVLCTPADIDHCAMVTMIDALEYMEKCTKANKTCDKTKYHTACAIVNHVMTDGEYSLAVNKLKEYWNEDK